MTKEEIVNKLKELNIKFDILQKKADLYALLPENIRLEIEKLETLAQKQETVTEEPTLREKAWAKLIENYKVRSPKAYEARVASGEDFSKIPPSFQGVWKVENGKEIIY